MSGFRIPAATEMIVSVGNVSELGKPRVLGRHLAVVTRGNASLPPFDLEGKRQLVLLPS